MINDNKNKIKILTLLSIFLFLFSFTFISSQTYKQGQNIELRISCGDVNCSKQINLTITYPNSSVAIGNKITTLGNGFINYTFSNTLLLGNYNYFTSDGFSSSFEITPSGQGGNENIFFFLFVIFLIYSITFIGFFGKNIPITILGGMALLFLGVYLVNNGIIIFRDNITNYISYLTIAIGGITSFWAILEQLDFL